MRLSLFGQDITVTCVFLYLFSLMVCSKWDGQKWRKKIEQEM